MASNPHVLGLLEEMLDSGKTPEEVCRDCPDLLPEVRQRWQAFCRIDPEVGAWLPEPGTRPEATVITPPPLTAELPQIPGYEVEAVLGRGGMGVVFKARHLTLKRVVALKMLLAGAYARPEELARFRREAEAVAALRHPNIVPVHDAGDIAGRPYFTMECVEGGSLAQSLAGKPQPPHRAAELVATLASAVQFAHKCGFIHRDLKPANVLLTADGVPMITDFGLVRSIVAGPEVTRSGDFLGTPCYMAPEQARGHTSAVGPAADIYALGVVLYEMLTGRPPFEGETAADTLQKVVGEDPVPPSRLNPKVPPDLDTICLKCLQKSPARRYASAQDLADELHRFLDGKPVLARPVGVLERAGKWARRRPAAALMLAAFLVMVGAATGTGLWLRHQEAKREGEAQKAIETALTRVDDCRANERWSEGLLVLSEASTHVANAHSPLLENRFRQVQLDFRFAAELDRVRTSRPRLRDVVDHRQRAAAFQAAFERAGCKIGDDTKPVADFIVASSIRDQLLAAVDDWAVAAYLVKDQPLVERLLQLAREADPEPRWRDRFRQVAAWGKREQLLQLAAEAFTTSPAPRAHQLALLGCLLSRAGVMSRAGDFTSSLQFLGEGARRHPGNFWVNRERGDVLSTSSPSTDRGAAARYSPPPLGLRPGN